MKYSLIFGKQISQTTSEIDVVKECQKRRVCSQGFCISKGYNMTLAYFSQVGFQTLVDKKQSRSSELAVIIDALVKKTSGKTMFCTFSNKIDFSGRLGEPRSETVPPRGPRYALWSVATLLCKPTIFLCSTCVADPCFCTWDFQDTN